MRPTCKMKATLPFYAANSARTWHANEQNVVSILYSQTQNWGNKHHILCYNFYSKDSSNHYWQFMKFQNFFLLGNSLPYTNRQYCGARWSLAESFVGKLFSLSAAWCTFWQTDKHFPRSWTNSTLHYPQVVNYKGKPIWLLMKQSLKLRLLFIWKRITSRLVALHRITYQKWIDFGSIKSKCFRAQ